MYGVEWLMGLGLLGLVAGLLGGYLVARRWGAGAGRVRELEAELESARRELADYREEVVSQFSETARRFQTLNDSYTDLHQQLAKSSSILCGDVSGPLLAAPSGHQDLLPREARQRHPNQAREEPSAGLDKEPSAGLDKEPSVGSDREPSAAEVDQEPSAGLSQAPSSEQDREPDAPAAATGEASRSGADPGDEGGGDIRVSEPGTDGTASTGAGPERSEDAGPQGQDPEDERERIRRAAGPR